MTATVRVLALAATLAAASCSASGPSAAGFASRAGVLACADVVAWGTVAATRPGPDGLEVTLDVQEWVHPARGAPDLTFVADDPAQEVGAPAWRPGADPVLVVLSDDAPASWWEPAEGREAVQQWRAAGSPRTPRTECEQA
jgi:hypothetical protein